MKNTTADLIFAMMRNADMTLTELSKAIGRSYMTVYGWYSGRNEPKFSDMEKIMQVTNHEMKIRRVIK